MGSERGERSCREVEGRGVGEEVVLCKNGCAGASAPGATGLATEGGELEVRVHVLRRRQHQRPHRQQRLPHLHVPLHPSQPCPPRLPCQLLPHACRHRLICTPPRAKCRHNITHVKPEPGLAHTACCAEPKSHLIVHVSTLLTLSYMLFTSYIIGNGRLVAVDLM